MNQQTSSEKAKTGRIPFYRRRIFYVVLILVLVLALLAGTAAARFSSLRRSVLSVSQTEATVHTGTASRSEMDTGVYGTGTLTEEEAEELSLPSEVTIEKWYVENGDTVAEGEPLASVDPVSVSTAITSLQAVIADLDEELAESLEAAENGESLLSDGEEGGADYEALCDALLDRRGELEEELQDLFILYEEGVLTAPCSGVVSGLSGTQEGQTEETESGESAETESEEAGNAVSEEGKSEAGSSSVSLMSFKTAGAGTSGGIRTMSSVGGLPESEESEAEGNAEGEGQEAETAAEEAAETPASETAGSEQTEEETQANETETTGEETQSSEESGTGETETEESRASSKASKPTVKEGAANYAGIVTGKRETALVLFILPQACDVADYTDLSSLQAIPEEEMSEVLTLTPDAEVPLFVREDRKWRTQSLSALSVGDRVLVTYDQDGTLLWLIRIGEGTEEITGQEEAEGIEEDSALFPSVGDLSGDQTGNLTGRIPDSTAAGTLADLASEEYGTETLEELAQEAASSVYRLDESVCLVVTPQESMTVTVTIDELDILSLAVGQSVQITLNALPGRSFAGEVTGLDEQGVNSGGSTKYTAEITLPREDGMWAGMNASVFVLFSTESDVLTIPEAALVEEDDAVFVYTAYDEAEDELSGRTEVTTGLSDGENVEIVSGLSEGDVYYYRILDVVNPLAVYTLSGGTSFFGR